MLLLGIFYSSSKPLMNMYLRPVMDDIIALFRDPYAFASLCMLMQATAVGCEFVRTVSIFNRVRNCCGDTSWANGGQSNSFDLLC